MQGLRHVLNHFYLPLLFFAVIWKLFKTFLCVRCGDLLKMMFRRSMMNPPLQLSLQKAHGNKVSKDFTPCGNKLQSLQCMCAPVRVPSNKT